MTDATFNLLQLEQRPNWYSHLGAVEAAMAEERRIWDLRTAAGWSCDEGGWYSPNEIHESDWEHEWGYPFPEDEGYAACVAALDPYWLTSRAIQV